MQRWAPLWRASSARWPGAARRLERYGASFLLQACDCLHTGHKTLLRPIGRALQNFGSAISPVGIGSPFTGHRIITRTMSSSLLISAYLIWRASKPRTAAFVRTQPTAVSRDRAWSVSLSVYSCPPRRRSMRKLASNPPDGELTICQLKLDPSGAYNVMQRNMLRRGWRQR